MENLELLTSILSELNKPTLGFHDNVGLIYVYCNRQHGFNWYTLNSDQRPQAINHKGLTGYIKGLRFDKVERRGEETHKLLTTVEADRTYILESGYTSHFSKGMLAAIANLTLEQLKSPITIQPQPGDESTVLFCKLWSGLQEIKSAYDQNTNWREVAQVAIALVKSLPS